MYKYLQSNIKRYLVKAAFLAMGQNTTQIASVIYHLMLLKEERVTKHVNDTEKASMFVKGFLKRYNNDIINAFSQKPYASEIGTFLSNDPTLLKEKIDEENEDVNEIDFTLGADINHNNTTTAASTTTASTNNNNNNYNNSTKNNNNYLEHDIVDLTDGNRNGFGSHPSSSLHQFSSPSSLRSSLSLLAYNSHLDGQHDNHQSPPPSLLSRPRLGGSGLVDRNFGSQSPSLYNPPGVTFPRNRSSLSSSSSSSCSSTYSSSSLSPSTVRGNSGGTSGSASSKLLQERAELERQMEVIQEEQRIEAEENRRQEERLEAENARMRALIENEMNRRRRG